MTTPERAGPAPEALPKLVLKLHEDKRVRQGHDWVFSNEIDTRQTPLTDIAAGDAVTLYDARGKFLAHALANPHALICARVLSRDAAETIDSALLSRRLSQALSLRQCRVTGEHYRLVYGESDSLPGLVVDRYGDVLVAQTATWGMQRLQAQIAQALFQLLPIRLIVWKNDSSARDLEQLPKEVTTDWRPELPSRVLPEYLQIVEQSLSFRVPLSTGQKTGWFFDQTENRARLAGLIRPGDRILDVCSYAGAWALTALKRGAATALCIDSSESALEAAAHNARLNGVEIEARRGDAFDVLAGLAAEGRRFDVAIVDPPAFIKRRKDQPQGEAAYKKLNALALQLLSDEALLLSCSCSFHLAAEQLPSLLQAAATQAGRRLRIIAQGGQSADHPVHPAMSETRYLKALFCQVSR